MGNQEQRFRDGTGERYLKNGKVRCQGCSKTKIKQLRILREDPSLRADDLWPDAQCEWPAVEGTFGCELHGGKSPNANKRSLVDWMPIDLREKIEILEQNKDQLFNRDNEIAQLIAINAQLYESMDDLVIGSEGYAALIDAKKQLAAGDVAAAMTLITIVLNDTRTEREVRAEMRENIKLIDKLTITQFNIRKDLKLMATIDQVRNLLHGMYQAFERIAAEFIPDDKLRGKATFQFATHMRELANARHITEISNGK